jgi:hypothetical protein
MALKLVPCILNPFEYFTRICVRRRPLLKFMSVTYQSIHDLVVNTPYLNGTGFGSGTGGQ